MLEKPVVAFYVGSFKNKLLEHFGAEMTFDKRVSLLIFPHTAGKLALVGGEDVLGRIIREGMGGGAAPQTVALFMGLTTVERDLFRFDDELIRRWGLQFIDTVVRDEITDAPGMHTWRWWDGDFGWTHTIIEDPAVLRITSPRLSIRALDVDWGPAPHCEHNRVYADGHYIGTMTGTPPRRWDNEWSVSKFEVPPHLIEDGVVNIWVNIDSRHTQETWVVNIASSTLEFTALKVQAAVEGVVIPEEVLAEIRKWLQGKNIGREEIGPIPIVIHRTVHRIVDGDDFTIKEPPITVGGRQFHQVRLKGINAPEWGWWWVLQNCPNQHHHGGRAADELGRLLPRGTHIRISGYYPLRVCEGEGIWRIFGGRISAFVSARVGEVWTDISRHMLLEGYAPLWAAYGTEIGIPRFRELRAAHESARARGVGIWGPCPWPIRQFRFVLPPVRRYALWWLPWQFLYYIVGGSITGWPIDEGGMPVTRILCYQTGEYRLMTDAEWRRTVRTEDWVLFNVDIGGPAGTEWEGWRRR